MDVSIEAMYNEASKLNDQQHIEIPKIRYGKSLFCVANIYKEVYPFESVFQFYFKRIVDKLRIGLQQGVGVRCTE